MDSESRRGVWRVKTRPVEWAYGVLQQTTRLVENFASFSGPINIRKCEEAQSSAEAGRGRVQRHRAKATPRLPQNCKGDPPPPPWPTLRPYANFLLLPNEKNISLFKTTTPFLAWKEALLFPISLSVSKTFQNL